MQFNRNYLSRGKVHYGVNYKGFTYKFSLYSSAYISTADIYFPHVRLSNPTLSISYICIADHALGFSMHAYPIFGGRRYGEGFSQDSIYPRNPVWWPEGRSCSIGLLFGYPIFYWRGAELLCFSIYINIHGYPDQLDFKPLREDASWQ